MTGLAAILDENARLRRRMAEMEAAHAAALVERDAKLEALQHKAEQLAQALELLQLQHLGPRSKRFIDDAPNTQTPLPFAADFPPPPRAPVPDPQRDDEPADGDADADPAKPTAPKRKRAQGAAAPRRRSKEDFDHLKAVTVECKAADARCTKCDGPLRVIGQAESFRLEWVPGHFVRHDVLRDKCACPSCPDQGVLTVSGPYALNRAMAGNRLVARVLVDKFADHIPLHRQVSRMAREGFEVGSHTLSGWVLQAAALLPRIADAIRTELLAQRVLQGDDTGLPVQDGGDGRLRKGRMWVVTDQHMAFFLFTESKAGEHPVELLEGFSGEVLLVDGGSEFNEVVRQRELERAGCWAHLRTYFHDALELRCSPGRVQTRHIWCGGLHSFVARQHSCRTKLLVPQYPYHPNDTLLDHRNIRVKHSGGWTSRCCVGKRKRFVCSLKSTARCCLQSERHSDVESPGNRDLG